MIGVMKGLNTQSPCIGIQPPVSGDNRAIAYFPDTGEIINRTVQIDHQPGIVGQYRRHIETFAKSCRNPCSTDIISDVPVEKPFFQLQSVQGLRHTVTGMITDNNTRRQAFGINNRKRSRFILGKQNRRHLLRF